MSNFNSVAKDNKLGMVSTSSKGYTLDAVIITANNGKQLDIKSYVHDIKIKEGLHRSAITVEIFIIDPVNLTNELKLSANEKINLQIGRNEPLLGDQGFNLELYIGDISNYSEPTPASKSYTLVCVSKHMYLNNKKLLNRPFEGTAKDEITKIVTTSLSSKLQSSGSSKGIMKGIYPNLQPLDAISWLLRNSFDDNTQMYFFESAKYGLTLTSYSAILNQDTTYAQYNRNPVLTASMYRSPASKMFEEDRLKIQKISSSLNVSKLSASKKGAFGAVLNGIDISTKTISETLFNYKIPNKKLNSFPPINDKMTVDGQKILDFKEFKQHWISYNDNAFDTTHNNYHNSTKDQALMKSRSSINSLDTVIADVELAGDFNLTPGVVIGLSVLKQPDVTQELAEGEPELFDNYISGAYLVSSIVHHFGKDGYNIKARVKKDSFMEEQLRKNDV